MNIIIKIGANWHFSQLKSQEPKKPGDCLRLISNILKKKSSILMEYLDRFLLYFTRGVGNK